MNPMGEQAISTCGRCPRVLVSTLVLIRWYRSYYVRLALCQEFFLLRRLNRDSGRRRVPGAPIRARRCARRQHIALHSGSL